MFGMEEAPVQADPVPEENRLNAGLRGVEEQMILDTLREHNGSRKETADTLGISPRTLRYKLARMRESGIQIPR
jgi:two-component system response regulator FlrC